MTINNHFTHILTIGCRSFYGDHRAGVNFCEGPFGDLVEISRDNSSVNHQVLALYCDLTNDYINVEIDMIDATDRVDLYLAIGGKYGIYFGKGEMIDMGLYGFKHGKSKFDFFDHIGESIAICISTKPILHV